MKKIFSFLFFIVFSLLLTANVSAQENDPVLLFESIKNTNALDSYELEQTLNGEFQVEEPFSINPSMIDGKYFMFVKSRVFNKKPYQPDVHTDMKFRLVVNVDGEDQPFDELVVTARAEVISLFNKGIYLRLRTADLLAEGVPADELDGYKEARAEFLSYMNAVKGKWVYLPISEFQSELNDIPTELEFLFDQEKLSQEIQKIDDKKSFEDFTLEMVDAFSAAEGLSETEVMQVKAMVKKVFASKLFNVKKLDKGEHAGFHSFFLNRNRLYNLILELATDFNESLSESEAMELKDMLGKFYLSGHYKENQEFRLFDEYYINLNLRDIDALKKSTNRLSYKLSKMNEADPVYFPADYLNMEEFMSLLFFSTLGTSAPSELGDLDEDF